jgi:hypothetical protein
LSASGHIPAKLSPYTGNMVNGSGFQLGVHLPKGPVKQSMWKVGNVTAAGNIGVMHHIAYTNVSLIGQNYMALGKNCSGLNLFFNGDSVQCGLLKPEDAMAIDKKIDDGMPNSGDVLGLNGTIESDYNGPLPSGYATNTCQVPNILLADDATYNQPQPYNLTNTNAPCSVAFRLIN